MTGIKVQQLRKTYGDREVLGGISFSVPPGQICGYLGPNGAGKSTTIKILAGILRAESGQASVAGHDVVADGLLAKRALGYVPESGALYGLLSIREHLHLVADLYELEPASAGQKVGQALELFELEEVADQRVDTLSKGQRQKTALAAGLLHDPEVILFDEPLNGLDANAARQLKDLITGLAARGKTILYCSHILDVVERICDRAVILAEGQIVADAPTSELLAKAESLEAVFRQLTRAADDEVLREAFLDGPAEAPPSDS
ncbi:MAG: ABC transporter ATP-binding protein [Planctomycetes bacterium]|nr:ABC transporter ATP-binding protein [Planctomycetota bacterium]